MRSRGAAFGTTSTSRNPTHTFASAGTFTVSLWATNSAGTRTEKIRGVEHRDAGPPHIETTPRIGAPARNHDAVDPLGEKGLDVLRLTLGIVGGVAHEDGDAAVGQALLQPFHDRDGEAAERIG